MIRKAAVLQDEVALRFRERKANWKTVVAFILIFFLSACEAKGEYRLPYFDNTSVAITADADTHANPAKSMYDMVASPPTGLIVAAAPGWVRFIEDSNSGIGSGPNNYVWIEHPYPYCQDPQDPQRADWPGKPQDYSQTCTPCDEEYCNEWTVYAHFATGTVSGSGFLIEGLSEGDWVDAGDIIGIEGAVGQAQGVHLHWHVAVIDPNVTPDQHGYYEAWVNQPGIADPELIPLVCHAGGKNVLKTGNTYTAAPCP